MTRLKLISAPLTALCVLLATPALGASASARPATTATSRHALQTSAELWATIDACNPADEPDTVGVRGSMPGNGQAGEVMYMGFRLQYLDTTIHHWVDLSTSATPDYSSVGGARSARQAGRSFQLVPVPGKPAFILRGVVSFQWRRGTRVEESISRPTTAGHKSLAGANPKGFSAATCSIG